MNGIVVAFEGRIGQDAELRFTAGGKPMCSFSAAVETDQAREGKPAVSEWIRCVVFGDGAEALTPQLGKGDMVYIEGRLSLNRWNGPDGKERSGLNVVVTLAQPMGKIGKRALVQQAQQNPAPDTRPVGAQPQAGRQAQRPAMGQGREMIEPDDLPF